MEGASRAGSAVSIFAGRNVVIALIDAGVWASWSALCGYCAHRLSPARLAHDNWLFRLRGSESGGRIYERWFRIKRWKDRLPDAGDLFQGGVSKKRLLAVHDREHLERFAAETRRAELTHWLILAATPWFFLWNPWWLGLAMVGYGMVANIPCVAIQRYNRARLLRAIQRPPAPRTA
jgi:glycosyl-4,4'-diaponeurosporenoate acyltransferase